MARTTEAAARSSSTPRASAKLPFERVLVPVDFSSAARAAFAFAMQVAEQWGSEVVLFHAAGLDQNDEFLDHTGVPWGRSDVLADAYAHLRRFADTVVPGSSERVRIEAVREESPLRGVVAASVRTEPSLIVLGKHSAPRRRLRRSLAERIASRVACAVMFVRGAPESPVDADE